MATDRQPGPACGCQASRRDLLLGLAGAALAGPVSAAGQPEIVDVHSHFMAPALRPSAGPMAGWSVERHLDDMAKAGVGRSILSVTTPGAPTRGTAARGWIRQINEYGARLKGDHRQAFGVFTFVSLDDLDGALAEVAYGLDTLKANGVGLFTSYGGKYLGDPSFDPLFEELNRRRAIVYVHPTSGTCCTNALPGVPDTIIEYGTDTTRAITRYIYSGSARRYPNVRMIWSHSGGTLPFLIERFDFADRSPATRERLPGGFRAALSPFYFDVAQASNRTATGALRQVVPPNRILFGTDYPYRTLEEHVAQLRAGGVFNRAEMDAVLRGNLVRGLAELMV